MYVCVWVCTCDNAYDVQKRALDLLKLEIWEVGSFLIWMLGTEFKSFAIAICALTC